MAAAVTFGPYGSDPYNSRSHLALQPGSFSFGSDYFATKDTRTGREKPFWPWLQSWPTVTKEFAPQERRASISETTVQVLADSRITARLIDRGGGQKMTARIDLVPLDANGRPMVTLEHVYPLMGGKVSAVQYDRRTGGCSLTITDGDPDVVQVYPPGPITRQDFPDAPPWVVDVNYRRVIVGPFPERLICVQIDRERKVFYLCDPPATLPPTRFQKGGVELPSGLRHEIRQGPNFRYSAIVSDVAADELLPGVTAEVSCSGGVGINDKNVFELLLSEQQGLQLSANAKMLLSTFNRDFGMGVTFDGQSDVLSLIRNRIQGQTPFCFTLARNQVDLLRLNGVTPTRRLGVGTGLLFRLDKQDPETSVNSVFNAIEVRAGRDQFASSSTTGAAPLIRIYRDSTHGTAAIRHLCRKSEQLFGRRFLAIDANDLGVIVNSAGQVIGCPSGEILADLVVKLSAMPHRRHGYQMAYWYAGLGLNWNDRVSLTDPDEKLDDEPTRVVKLSYTATGVEAVFQTEDQT